MADFPSFDDLFRIGRNEMLVRNSKLAVEAVDRDGTDANALNAAAAAIGDECITQISSVVGMLYIDSAVGDDLRKLVFDRYGLEGKPATSAQGYVQFTTTAPSALTFTIPSESQLSTADGHVFETTEAATFIKDTTGPVNVAVTSVLGGLNQQAKPGTITSIKVPITGQPSDLAVTNAAATAGAADEETDSSLRARAKAFYLTTRRGTVSAIEVAALGVHGVEKAKAFELQNATGYPDGIVTLVIADSFTDVLAELETTPATYAVQSQALAASVWAELEEVRPAGVYVDVFVARVVLLPVMLALSFSAGTDTQETLTAATAAVVNYTNTLAPGETWKRSDALETLTAVSGLVLTGNEVISPSGDVVPTMLEVLRTQAAIVGIGIGSAN